MAGAGYKLFATGDVLTAAQVNTYLMQQTVMVFASSAARTSALSGVLAEGMVSYLQDTNTLEVYDGSAWIGATGDITALTAGTGISITNPTGPVPTVAIDTAVTADLTTGQTLTNKTLTSPVLTTPSISNINAKGDILVGTADNTLGVITAGNNGEMLVADSSASTGLRWQGNFAAGKNAIINGDFRINQRSFSSTTANNTYTFDRWVTVSANTSQTFTSQSFTPGAAPVTGYESATFLQCATTASAGAYALILQKIEDVRTFANQTVTVSFWAKSASGTPKIATQLTQNFGTGGSSNVGTSTVAFTLSTSWARYSTTFSIPSISGKTIGTNSCVEASLIFQNDYEPVIGQQTATIGVWGMQVEIGSTATSFETATGTIQGELAACQRYYFRQNAQATTAYAILGAGAGNSTTQVRTDHPFPVQMRVVPTAIDYPTISTSFTIIKFDDTATGAPSVIGLDTNITTPNVGRLNWTCTSAVANTPYYVRTNGNVAFYLGWSAEL